ncbi:hypothetical protein Zm00014a_014032 [Zea mays]|uniref:Uncharacterized protein n=2 Tax=Zea mays TaxID=4577 RepID=A0A1D6HWN8_MAIZE|nr:hypothetical protein ZEAMMB73_Zm00001d019293 [Zea mays]ONM52639.1 hypothetical protein ZEAMMB73_Zm00001d019293 [Zea mays]ONM52642.1 hypothetical protein ZEAMMB73_Zm00001d019293 [Zea mays]PWZ15630.1 hypothetical protein Zm00014a_014032 [Zea mays]
MTTVSGWDDESVLLNVMVIEATLVYESHRKRRASTCSNDDDTRSNTKYGDTVDRSVLILTPLLQQGSSLPRCEGVLSNGANHAHPRDLGLNAD